MSETLLLCLFYIFSGIENSTVKNCSTWFLIFGRLNPAHGVISNPTHQDSSTKQNDKICARKTGLVTKVAAARSKENNMNTG